MGVRTNRPVVLHHRHFAQGRRVGDSAGQIASAPVPGRETSSKFATVIEVLVEYSDEERRFKFTSAGLPRMMRVAENTSRVKDEGTERSVLSFDIHVESSPSPSQCYGAE